MRIESVEIKNYRVFKTENINFDSYCCLVGLNGAGKSTVLCALNIFFHEIYNPSIDVYKLKNEDFYNYDTSEPIEITVTFIDLNNEAKEDFKDYVRQDKLVISAKAEFDPNTLEAEVKQFGQRLGIKDFAKFFDAEKQKAQVADLKLIYDELQKKYQDLPSSTTKANMIGALHEFESNHPEICELISSEDQFYGFTRGVNRLEKYIQWVFIPAVKDASSEELETKNSALGKLLTRTVRSKVNFDEALGHIRNEAKNNYQSMLDAEQHVLSELSKSLSIKLSEWAHPEAKLVIEWSQDPEKSVRIDEPFAQIKVGEGPFIGKIARLGHGLQRSFLLAILQELSSNKPEEEPTLIMACEEPELYQHPPQIRHMAEILKKLSIQGSQIIVTTHSPHFVGGKGFEAVRLIRRENRIGPARSFSLRFSDLAENISKAKNEEKRAPIEGIIAKIHQELQPSINEIFFSPILILVEGIEDLAYIVTYMHLLKFDEIYRKLGCNIVHVNGKSHLLQPFIISKHMGIPTFIIFDSDAHQPDKNGSTNKHKIDNAAILRAAGYNADNPLSAETIWKPDLVMWGSEFGKEIHDELQPGNLESILEKTRIDYGHVCGLEKNALFISSWLESAWQSGLQSKKLVTLCELIITFGEKGSK